MDFNVLSSLILLIALPTIKIMSIYSLAIFWKKLTTSQTIETKTLPEPKANQDIKKRQLFLHPTQHKPKKYQRTPTAILTSNLSIKQYVKIARTVDTGRPGWEDRLHIIPKTFLEFDNDIETPSEYSEEYNTEYLDDLNTESWYNDHEDPDRIEIIRDHNEFLACNN